MATTEFTHPTSPTFADSSFTAPPRLIAGKSVEDYLGELDKYINDQFVGLMDMQASITQGWIVDGLRVINLTAQTIESESIFTQDLFVGDDQLIKLSGTTNTIEVRDEANILRVRIGDLGTGSTNWGIEHWDSSGVLRFSVGDTVFIDGGVITNATITGAKIANSTITGGNIGSNTVTNGNIASGLSASKVTTGTLTVSSSGVAIDVTGGGAALFRSGGDIEMRASSNNHNYIKFQTSTSSDRGYLNYLSTTNFINLVSTGGASLALDSDNDIGIIADADIVLSAPDIQIGFTSSQLLDITAKLNSSIVLNTDSAFSIGSNSVRLANLWSDLVNGADYCFTNGIRIVEPDRVYSDATETGLYFMSPDWQVMGFWSSNGSLILAGQIEGGWVFPLPDIPRVEHD